MDVGARRDTGRVEGAWHKASGHRAGGGLVAHGTRLLSPSGPVSIYTSPSVIVPVGANTSDGVGGRKRRLQVCKKRIGVSGTPSQGRQRRVPEVVLDPRHRWRTPRAPRGILGEQDSGVGPTRDRRQVRADRN